MMAEPQSCLPGEEDDGSAADRMSRPNALLVILALSGCLWLVIVASLGGI